MNKTVYITGGTGFLGSALVELYTQSGSFVYVQTRYPNKNSDKNLVKFVSGAKEIDRKIDLLINLCGKPLATHWTNKSKAEIYRSRVESTQKLVADFSSTPEWAPTKVLSASAIGYYSPGDERRTEQSLSGNSFSANLCKDWEHAASKFKQLGSSVTILRLGVVLDPQGGSLKAMLPSFKLGLGARLGTGKQWFSWISLADLIGIFGYCTEQSNLPEIINAVAPEAVTNSEFTKLLAQSLRRPAFLSAPTSILKLALGEGAEDFLLANLNVSPAYLQQAEFNFQYPNLKQYFEKTLNPAANERKPG